MSPSLDDVPQKYDVRITTGSNEFFFILSDAQPFTEADVNAFAPKMASPGAQGYDNLDLYATVAQESWHHGSGFVWFSEQFGFSHSDAGPGSEGEGVDTRFSGWAQIFTTVEDTTGSPPTQAPVAAADSASFVHMALASTGGHVRVNSAFSWDQDRQMALGANQTANDVLVVGSGSTGNLFVSVDTNRLQASTDEGAAWANAGNATNPPNNLGALAVGGGYMWGVEDGRNELHYAANVAGSDWEGSGDANEIVVGPGNPEAVNDIAWWNGALYIGRPDDLYVVQNFTPSAIGFEMGVHTDNFKELMPGPDGQLWFISRNQIYSWNGQSTKALTNRTPKPYDVSLPYDQYGQFSALSTRDGFVFVVGSIQYGGISNPTFHLLAWNGTGWSILADLTGAAASGDTMHVCHPSHSLDYFIVAATHGGTLDWDRIPLQDDSSLPFARYRTSTFSGGAPTSDPHYLYSSIINLGLIEIQKFFVQLDIWSDNLLSTGGSERMIDVYYQINQDGTWRAWNTYDTSPYETAASPSTNNVARSIQFRFNLVTGITGQTPFLKSYALRLLPRPDTLYGLSLNIVAADYVRLRDGGTSDYTAEDIRTNAQTIRDSTTPSTIYISPWLDGVSMACTSYSLGNVELTDDKTATVTLTFTQLT